MNCVVFEFCKGLDKQIIDSFKQMNISERWLINPDV